ncbi:MAG: methionine--tRNA ligase [Candidatus Asgardarchaeia archaeon]
MGKWLVCSAWPYINAMPHLGTMIGCVLSADIFARYLRLKGEDVVYVSGSDEHGTPIEVEAIKQNIDPKEYTDKMHKAVSELFEKWGISFSNYSRTESEVHKRFVQEFYKELYENGYVYEKEEELPYCPKCERFLPDRFIVGTCPYCGYEDARGDQCDNCGRLLDPLELIDPRCNICGSTPIIKKTKHWYFKLSEFEDTLKEYIEKNKELPENARKFSLQLLKEGLRDRSLTRDNKWGIPAPFPGAEGKTIYVWMEAVLGYISATIEWSVRNNNPEKWKEYWFDKDTKSVYFIAKDNIPFHTLIFPGLLLGSKKGYVLPHQVASTEFLLYEGKPFSKSRRIGVWADEALKYFPADYYRYVLIYLRPEKHDTSFTLDVFKSVINDELNDIIGNFIHRTLTFIYKNFGSKVPELKETEEDDEEMIRILRETPKKVGEFIESYRYRDALSSVVYLAKSGNQYLNSKKPWHTIKEKRDDAATTLHVCAQVVATLAILLEPFIPFTAEKIWKNLLNLDGSVHEQNWDKAGTFIIRAGHRINKPQVIFQKVPEDFKFESSVSHD